VPPLVAGPLDDLLIPFDPAATLEKIRGTFQLYAAADPKVAAAQDLMGERIAMLGEADQEAVAAVFWATYRRRLCAGARPARLRDWLSNGDRVLWAVQVALDTFLRPSELTDFAQAVRQLESSDSVNTSELTVARAELAQAMASDIGPIKLVPFWLGVAHHYAESYYHETHPPQPKGPYPDNDD
jgi:hypothetical protein